MSDHQANFIFKLRYNIVLESDLTLARMELGAYFPAGVSDVPQIADLAEEFSPLRRLNSFAALDSFSRPNGTQAMRAEGPLSLLPTLIRRLAFVQRIYCITRGGQARWLSSAIEDRVGPVTTQESDGDTIVIQAIPHYALFEFSDLVARRSSGAVETQRNLGIVLEALLNVGRDQRAARLAQNALSARTTFSPLSHDVHYYKAKFFPRLTRALLNLCAPTSGTEPFRVLDPFVGSGTTLLEAATLGMSAVGLDIDPLSVLISQVKLSVGQLDSRVLAGAVTRAEETITALAVGQLALFDVPSEQPPVTFPPWLMKNRKMTAQVAEELSREIHCLRAAVATAGERERPLFRVLMSDAIARRIRMRFLGTGVGRFSLSLAKTPAPQIFLRSLKRYVKVVANYAWLRQTIGLELSEVSVARADAREIPDLGAFDLLVTSPPYLPASSGRESYARARAPSLIALGMQKSCQVDRLVVESVGSMNAKDINLDELTEGEKRLVLWLQRDSLRNIKAAPTARYFTDMRRSFAEMFRVLRPGAQAVVVSGKQSTFYNFATREPLYVAHSAELLAQEASGVGFHVDALYDVQLQKANINARPRSLDDYYETLIVLRKPV